MSEARSRGFRTSKLNATIDYGSLKTELEQALRADQLYRLQNDAKLRAVEQNVPTYDDFRQMVNIYAVGCVCTRNMHLSHCYATTHGRINVETISIGR